MHVFLRQTDHSLLVLRDRDCTLSTVLEFQTQNRQQKAQNCKTRGTESTMKGPLFRV